jgi:hypothetical protein
MWQAIAAQAAEFGAKALYGDKQAEKAHNRNVDNYRMRHRWEVEDLKLAGLNPILSATQGAPTLPGSPMPATPDSNIASAMQSIAIANEKQANIEKIKAEVKQLGILSDRTEQEINQIVQATQKMFQEEMKTKAETQMLRYEVGKEHVRSEFAFENRWMLKAEQLSKSLGVQVKDIIQILNIISVVNIGKSLFGKKFDKKFSGRFDPKTGEIFGKQ